VADVSAKKRLATWAPTACVVAMALPVPAGAAVRHVSDVYDLNDVMSTLSSGDEVVLAAGTYNLTLTHGYYITTPNITIRGATGNRDDVTLWGGGMNNVGGIHEAIQFVADDQTIRDLTIEVFYHHAIHFQPGADRSHVDNVRTLNIGQQHMKGGSSNPNVINDGIIENCLMKQTIARQDHPILNYTGGIDLLGATDWIIRDNVARDIQGETGEGGGAIFLWQKIVNPTVERNVVIDCDRGIAMGNSGYQNADNLVGGIVRNNFVSHANEVNLELVATTNLKVYNNTIYGPSGSSYNRAVSMEGAVTSGLELINNIIHGNIVDRGIPFTDIGNITGGTSAPSWFVDMPNGDLHLTELATAALDAAGLLGDVPTDFDEHPRPYGGTADVGADEWAMAGDADLDGDVDFDDFSTLAFSFGSSGGWTDGDFDRDEDVDFDDYSTLAFNYGWTHSGAGAPAGGTPVPEPATLAMAALGGLALMRRRRRRAASDDG
jgi:hypothetical protein